MRCLLLLLCSQAIVFSAGFTTPCTLNSDKSQYKKSRNPECFMNVTEIIRYHGYPSEEYQVTTEDGYILSLFRIPTGRNSQNTGKKTAVLLQHGALGDCIHWIFNLANNSLGFILADAGFDVWLGNSRGNTWSSKHKTLKPCQKEFWQFSFDEIGKYDIPAELYFIMNKTGQKHVYYAGHSEASAAGFIAFSAFPELAQRVKVFFALAPVTTVTHATGPAAAFVRLPPSLIRLLLGCKGALHQNELLKGPLTQFCRSLGKVCGSAFCYLGGGRIQNQNTSRTDTYIAHYPAGISVQNIIHWHQITHADQFQAYDYGSTENMKKYNQIGCSAMFANSCEEVCFAFPSGAGMCPMKFQLTCPSQKSSPPAYKIEKISIPIAVWSGGQDTLADPKDMAKLLPRITNLIYHEHFPTWGHLDFIWGLDATEKLYHKIIELLRKYF